MKKVLSLVIVGLVLSCLAITTGCQSDMKFELSNRILRKGENNGEEWKSRKVSPVSDVHWHIGNPDLRSK